MQRQRPADGARHPQRGGAIRHVGNDGAGPMGEGQRCRFPGVAGKASKDGRGELRKVKPTAKRRGPFEQY